MKLMTKNKTTYDSYAPDSFDNPPQGPVGVHRGNRSVAVRMAPYLVVIVVAALAGLLVWALFSGQASRLLPWTSQASSGTTSSSQASDTSSESSSSTQSSAPASSSTTSSASPSTSSSASAVGSVNKSSSVRIINATSINGYAAQKAAVLAQSGYTNVVASNPAGQVPTQSVVWYQNDADAATAKDVANTLGISSVQQVSGTAAPIVVVLLQ